MTVHILIEMPNKYYFRRNFAQEYRYISLVVERQDSFTIDDVALREKFISREITIIDAFHLLVYISSIAKFDSTSNNTTNAY